MTTFQTQSGRLKTAKKILTATTVTEIIAAGNDYAIVEFVRLANVAANTPTVILDIYDTGGAAVLAKIRGTKAMVANTPETETGPFILEPGESLRATASAANEVHVTATYTVSDLS